MDVTHEMNKPKEEEKPADFETAISEAGFGTFHLLLLLLAVPATCATVFESSTMSYILPVAECDLKLTLIDKGILNAITYAGMIISAIVWGYLSDTQGRRKILVYGYLMDSVCVLGSSLSQSFEMLVAFKFLGGFCVNGPSAVLFTYLTELHSFKQRARVMMILGLIMSMATLIIPLMAWAIFPRDWDFKLFDQFNVHSWQIFLLVSALPSFVSGIAFTILPESPKFLMSQGRNQEALRVFQKIYAFNKRKPRSTYPIHKLMEEVPDRDGNVHEAVYTIASKTQKNGKVKRAPRSFTQALHEGMQQFRPMFRKPILGHSIHVYVMQFCILLSLNTIRLWLPQLFASIAEYEALETTAEGSSNLCTILEFSINKTATAIMQDEVKCETLKNVSVNMYTNNIIVALAGMVGYLFAGMIVRALGAKRMLTLSLIISASCGVGLYWSTSGLTTLVISSIFVTLGSISTSSLLGVVVNIFPTSLKTLIIAISMMFGRLGGLSGNMLFPVFIQMGCIPPFLMVGLVMFCAAALSFILPSGKKSTFT